MEYPLQDNYDLHRKLITCEDLAEKDLDTLLGGICDYLKKKGFTVKRDDTPLSKRKYTYKNMVAYDEEHSRLNEGVLLCASNGKEVTYSGHRVNNCSRSIVIFTLLHMTGHLWQWNCRDANSGLRYTGTAAWKLGKEVYAARYTPQRNNIIGYEKEAIAISLKNLEQIYQETDLDDDFKKQFTEHYTYYSLLDLNALDQYFDTFKHINIFKLRSLKIPDLHLGYEINAAFSLTIRKRRKN